MAVARLAITSLIDGGGANVSATRWSSTSAPTRRCCAPAARRTCGCSSPRTGRWARACTRSPRQRGARSRRVPLRDPPAPRRDRRRHARGHGPGRRGRSRQRAGGRDLGRGRGACAAAALVRQRRRHARRAARQRVRRRRPRADAGRVPDRVEQDPDAPAGRGARPQRTSETCARPNASGCSAAARTTGRGSSEAWGGALLRTDAADRRAIGCRCGCACSAARTSATRG